MITAFGFMVIASTEWAGDATGQLARLPTLLNSTAPNSNYLTTTTTTNATNDQSPNITGVQNTTTVTIPTTNNATSAPIAATNRTVQGEPQPTIPLLQQQPSTFQRQQALQQQAQPQQQQTIAPSPNATNLQQLQQQIPPPGQAIQQQLPVYQQPFTTQQQVLPQSTTQQQQFFPSSPLTSVQPPGAYYPPSSTTFPPAIYPPSGTTFPSNVYPPVGTYPSTGFPMAAAGGMGGVSTPSQIIAPWFPSLPAISCGGTFVMTVEGIPEGNNGNGDDRITPSGGGDNNGNSDNDDDNKQYSGKSNRRLAVQINSDNSQIITGQQQDPIFGQIFQGQRNIDQNKANDFDIRSIFNDCQVSTYSKLG
jgi:hypothetical protein